MTPDGCVPLPNVKRLIPQRFGVQLNETTLGYAKVSELLKDRRFADVCEVQMQRSGYVVRKATPRLSLRLSLSDALAQTLEEEQFDPEPSTDGSGPVRGFTLDQGILRLEEAEALAAPTHVCIVSSPSLWTS